MFKIKSDYLESGDQPQAICKISAGLNEGKNNQILQGITGSGKTFTMAKIIERTQRPAIIMVHNKTLAAQLYQELKDLFPDNAVEYFISYYDYYQPEAYIARTDTYIEKDSSINEQIDLLRHSATRSLIERKDVIVVSSVSCIYGIGSKDFYAEMCEKIISKSDCSLSQLIKRLINLQYIRNDFDFQRGRFRLRGDTLDIFPSHLSESFWRISFFGDYIEEIIEADYISSKTIRKLNETVIYPNSHYVTPREVILSVVEQIQNDLKKQIEIFTTENKLLEAQRIEQRTKYDIEMLSEVGSCKGIENYSRYLSGREEGSPPPTLFEYLPDNALLFVDESHITIPQIGAMYNGDRSRKTNLVDYGFRLPSAMDNRPLKFSEWDEMRPQTIYVSATPGRYELEVAKENIVELIIRPTGLLDPICEVRPTENQMDDLVGEINKTIKKGNKVLITTLTKKMAENLSEFLRSLNFNVCYLHSEVQTLERIKIINSLRKGEIDMIVGINLLREGLDIPECELMVIMDADKEGFLRSENSLIQTIGRAARNENGRVIMYADKITESMRKALEITKNRREKQIEHNAKFGITPKTITKSIKDNFLQEVAQSDLPIKKDSKEIGKLIFKYTAQMKKHSQNLEFEEAAKLRDKVLKLREALILD